MANIHLFMRNQMTIRHMRMLVAIDDHRSIIRAATFLNLSQPAVSKSLALLEETLGSPLFLRTKQGFVPTKAGTCLLTHSRGVLQRMEIAERELADAIGEGLHNISIGCLPGPSAYLMPRFLKRLQESMTRTTVSLREGTTEHLLSGLRSGLLDLALVLIPASRLGPEVSSEFLYSDRVVAAVRRDHPLLSRGAVGWGDLDGYPLVLPPQNSLARGAIEALFRDHDIDISHRRIDSVVTTANFGTIEITDSIGFMSRSLVTHFRKRSPIEFLPLDIPDDVVTEYAIVWDGSRALSEEHVKVLDLLRETVKDFLATRPD